MGGFAVSTGVADSRRASERPAGCGWCTRGRRRRLPKQLKVVTKSRAEKRGESRVLFFVETNTRFFTDVRDYAQYCKRLMKTTYETKGRDRGEKSIQRRGIRVE